MGILLSIVLTVVCPISAEVFAESKNACGSFFKTSSVTSGTKKRSQILEESGVTFFNHVTNSESAVHILARGRFVSIKTAIAENLLSNTKYKRPIEPLWERYNYVYVDWNKKSLDQHLNQKVPHDELPVEKSIRFSNISILLPISYADSEQFDHYSNSWEYGVGRQFTNENFADGMTPKNEGKTFLAEMVFRDELRFDPKDALLIVAPEQRDELILQLSELNPNVDWQKVVLAENIELIERIPIKPTKR